MAPKKGANILIDAAGNAKLADFGACMQLEVWGERWMMGWPLVGRLGEVGGAPKHGISVESKLDLHQLVGLLGLFY